MSDHLKKILITGASGAIGGALAKIYACSGVELHLHGRDIVRLDAVAAACRAVGCQVLVHRLDLRDSSAVRSWVGRLSSDRPFDLVIVCAGVNTNIGDAGRGEPWDEVETLLAVNLKATMAIVDSTLPSMRSRKKGQIVLISSLAGYFGLPVTPSYCASKAAVKAYGEALRGWLAPEGIRVNVVMPGYVESDMCAAMPGPKPFLWSAERAAWTIRKGVECNKARISFPFPLNLGSWFLAVLPARVSIKILSWLGYGR